MGEPFLGEIKIISWNFPPKGWAFCNGQFLPINQNQALFSILGTMYGGNGQTTFALPDFRGRTPVHAGSRYTVGERGGEAAHTVTISELPAHYHVVNASSQAGTTSTPDNTVSFAKAPAGTYTDPSLAPSLDAMNPQQVSSVGGSQAHENRQPYLVLNFIIALQGIFPSRN